MVSLVPCLYVPEYVKCLFCGGGVDLHFLEAAVESSVTFDAFPVFVCRGGTDALYPSSCERGFQDVGSIHAARCASGTYQGVYLVDEDDDVGVGLELFYDALDTLFEIAAVFRAGYDGGEVEREDALREEDRRACASCYLLCQPFHDGAFAYAGFADEDGVVLLPPAKNFCDARHLFLSSHDGVEAVGGRCCGEVGREAVEHGCPGLARGVESGGPALAHCLAEKP